MAKNKIRKERCGVNSTVTLRPITRKELATKIKVTEVTIRMWETGKTRIPDYGLVRLAEFFGCSIDYLLGRTDIRILNKTGGENT